MTNFENITSVETLVKFDLGCARYVEATREEIDARIARLSEMREKNAAVKGTDKDQSYAPYMNRGRWEMATVASANLNALNRNIGALMHLKKLRGL